MVLALLSWNVGGLFPKIQISPSKNNILIHEMKTYNVHKLLVFICVNCVRIITYFFVGPVQEERRRVSWSHLGLAPILSRSHLIVYLSRSFRPGLVTKYWTNLLWSLQVLLMVSRLKARDSQSSSGLVQRLIIKISWTRPIVNFLTSLLFGLVAKCLYRPSLWWSLYTLLPRDLLHMKTKY